MNVTYTAIFVKNLSEYSPISQEMPGNTHKS